MFRLALLSIAAVNAQVDSEPVDAQVESVDTPAARLLGRKQRVTANLCGGDRCKGFKGKATATQRGDGSIKWEIRVNRVNVKKLGFTEDENLIDQCMRNGFLWHVHQTRVPADGDCGKTGGHYDPTFECGPASNNTPEECEEENDGRLKGEDYKTRCTTETPEDCEYGDQSGKFDVIPAKRTRGRKNRIRAEEPEEQELSISDLKDKSLVLHCKLDDGGAPRVVCADFK